MIAESDRKKSSMHEQSTRSADRESSNAASATYNLKLNALMHDVEELLRDLELTASQN